MEALLLRERVQGPLVLEGKPGPVSDPETGSLACAGGTWIPRWEGAGPGSPQLCRSLGLSRAPPANPPPLPLALQGRQAGQDTAAPGPEVPRWQKAPGLPGVIHSGAVA